MESVGCYESKKQKDVTKQELTVQSVWDMGNLQRMKCELNLLGCLGARWFIGSDDTNWALLICPAGEFVRLK